MIVLLSITFVFIYNKIYKYALIVALLFALAFGIFMTGPMGEELIKKFKKRQPAFQFPDQKEIDEVDWKMGVGAGMKKVFTAEQTIGKWRGGGCCGPGKRMK